MTVIERGADALKKVAGLVFPMFARARDFATLGVAALWGLRLAALGSALGLLAAINSATGLRASLKAPGELLNRAWLPLLFLLVYALLWLGRWFWSQLGPGREEEGFPDIDRASLIFDRVQIAAVELDFFLGRQLTCGHEAQLELLIDPVMHWFATGHTGLHDLGPEPAGTGDPLAVAD